jgi:putative transposase
LPIHIISQTSTVHKFSQDCTNRYFLSFVVEVEPNITVAKNQSIGIDLGLKTFATMSDGEKVL